MLTPVPWRVVTDTALWSENWPGIPRPARGEIRTRFTHCTLCPAGCAVRARCVGDQPVSLIGLPGKPLCAFGLTGHQLPYHADRITQADARGAAEAIHTALSRRSTGESVAVLDLRPGRTASWTYRRAIARLSGGFYLAPQSALPAIDLDRVKTILSFGVPVLDGWGTPWNVLAARKHFRLIQAEPIESHTAALADEWLPIRRGSEEALSHAIHSVLAGGSGDLAAVADRTGLPKTLIVSVAQELARGGALVLALEESAGVMELNRLLAGHAIIGRQEAPVPPDWKQSAAPVTSFGSVPDASIRVLLVDESVGDSYFPWSALGRKLTPDSVVVTFASSRSGYGRNARFTLPAAVYPETLDDIPAAIDSPVGAFRLAVPLVGPPDGAVNPARFIAEVAELDLADPLHERANAIHAASRGSVLSYADSQLISLRTMKADEFWKTLNEGGCWIDDPGNGPPIDPRASAPAVVAMTWEMRAARGPMSPLVSKLYQESNLRVRV